MRMFIILAAILIANAVYDIGGKDMPWLRAIGFTVALTAALVLDALERRSK